MWAVAMVIPRLRSSGALSMAPYSRNFAKPFSACRLVMAAVRVVWCCQPDIRSGGASGVGVPFRDRRDRWYLDWMSSSAFKYYDVRKTYQC
jgi:hypothetical protein